MTNLYDRKIYSLIIDSQMKGLHGLIMMGATLRMGAACMGATLRINALLVRMGTADHNLTTPTYLCSRSGCDDVISGTLSSVGTLAITQYG